MLEVMRALVSMMPAGSPFPEPIECEVSEVGSVRSLLTTSKLGNDAITSKISFDDTEYEGVRLSVGDKLTVLAVRSPDGDMEGCLLDAGISTILPQPPPPSSYCTSTSPPLQLLHHIHPPPLCFDSSSHRSHGSTLRTLHLIDPAGSEAHAMPICNLLAQSQCWMLSWQTPGRIKR